MNVFLDDVTDDSACHVLNALQFVKLTLWSPNKE